MPDPDTPESTARVLLTRGVVHPWHHDIYGHMNVRHYAPFFDDASFHLYAALGLSLDGMLHDHGVHMVSARAETNFIQELKAGDCFAIDGAVLRLGNRSATFQLRMIHSDTGALHATYDLTDVIFDPKTRKSAPMPEAMRTALAAHLVTE
ncbi:MAG: acyl-CoA thioesterase [Pararhodobacter sp.]|nr:acyl-CoA thioesterase [Pararhodobacter sp.]